MKLSMGKEEHLKYLKYLENTKYAGFVIPNTEGSYYFNNADCFSEYVKLYREKCIKNGWINK